MSLENMTKEELLELVKEAVSSSVVVHPLSPEEIHWVRLAIKSEVERAEFRKAVIEKTLIGLIIAALGWLGIWLIDVFHTYFQHKP